MQASEKDLFGSLVGSTLRAGADAASAITLDIEKVEEYTAGGERFSVFLRGPADQPLGQGIHRLTPDGTQPFDVFLVPIALEDGTLVYEAAFNRVPPPAV